MGKAILYYVLRLLMTLICVFVVSIWLLKPTKFWTKKWHDAEDAAKDTVFGYYGLNFFVLAFPAISVAIIGLLYLNLQPWELTRRQTRTWAVVFSNPVVVNSFIGVLSTIEILSVFLFSVFLAWTFYARISNDFKKLMPVKTLKLSLWQLKYLRVATRFGLLAEACLALLLLPILRGLSVFRLLGIQFETSVKYHVWLGTVMVFFATFHGASTLFIWGISHNFQDQIWKWQKTGRVYLAGELALATGLIIWITSLPQIRRRRFEIFYYTHHLYIVFIVLFLFHAGDRHLYWIFPGIFLFGVDKLLRIVQSRSETCLTAARVFPCNSVELVLPKDPNLKYTPSSLVFLKIPSISKFQWHPFTISSSSIVDEHTMSVIIRCKQGWTNSLYDMIEAKLDSDNNWMKCIPIAVEGPYGPASVDFLRYNSLVLVAGGIGITPFLSILQEIACAKSKGKYKFSTTILLVYIVKSSNDISLLTPIASLLLKHPSQNLNLKLKFFVTREKNSNTTVHKLLSDSSTRVQTVEFGDKISTTSVLGQESSLWKAVVVGISVIMFCVFLICFNHIFVRSGNRKDAMRLTVLAPKKASKDKNPSWIADVIIISSFFLAILCGMLIAIVLRWRRLNKEFPIVTPKQSKAEEQGARESRSMVLKEHEVYFGGRPNFEDIFFKFWSETEGSDIGVLVCGPDSMKESVAEQCRNQSRRLNENKPRLVFHSLNFTL